MILILVNTFSTMIMRHSKLGLFNLMQTVPMDNEQVGEEVYISMINKAEKILLVYDSISNHNR